MGKLLQLFNINMVLNNCKIKRLGREERSGGEGRVRGSGVGVVERCWGGRGESV